MRIFCATPRHRSPLWGGLVAIPPSGGRGSRNRTYNLRFWRPTLCQLSYTPTNQLGNDLGNHASAHGTATFADSEAQTFFHGDGGDQLDGDRHVVARHHHLDRKSTRLNSSHLVISYAVFC